MPNQRAFELDYHGVWRTIAHVGPKMAVKFSHYQLRKGAVKQLPSVYGLTLKEFERMTTPGEGFTWDKMMKARHG